MPDEKESREAFFNSHKRGVCRVAYMLSGRSEVSEWLAGEAFQAVSDGWSDAMAPAERATWLYTELLTLYRAWMERGRPWPPKKRRGGGDGGDGGGAVPGGGGGGGGAGGAAVPAFARPADRAIGALASLPQEQREVLALHEGNTSEDVDLAAVVGLTGDAFDATAEAAQAGFRAKYREDK